MRRFIGIYKNRRVAIYVDWADWWVGVYRSDYTIYICPIPCLVIRWRRRRPIYMDRRQP